MSNHTYTPGGRGGVEVREGGEAMWLRKRVFPGSQRERSAPPELSKSDFVETDEAFGKVVMCTVPESKK